MEDEAIIVVVIVEHVDEVGRYMATSKWQCGEQASDKITKRLATVQ